MGVSFEEEIQLIENQDRGDPQQIFSNLTPWQRVQLARHPKRPFVLDYIGAAFSDFEELPRRSLVWRGPRHGRAASPGSKRRRHGDRHPEGTRNQREFRRNFGSAHPEGYRKALRLMRMADKFGLPIITLIAHAGAYPGIGAEERHIAEAIAVNLGQNDAVRVPIIAASSGRGRSRAR